MSNEEAIRNQRPQAHRQRPYFKNQFGGSPNRIDDLQVNKALFGKKTMGEVLSLRFSMNNARFSIEIRHSKIGICVR
jgi:hypothetical protein